MPNRSSSLPVLLLLLPLLLSWLPAAGGCASTPPVDAGAAHAFPPDVNIEVVVRRGDRAPNRSEAHLRPARFVLWADGSLRYAAKPPPRWGGGPPVVADRERVLTSTQVAALWTLATETGLTDPAAGQESFNFARFEPPPDGTAYLFAVRANGQRWSYVVEAAGDPPVDASTTQFVRHLGELVWLSDRPRPRVSRLGTRYDFGPDPYARFREP